MEKSLLRGVELEEEGVLVEDGVAVLAGGVVAFAWGVDVKDVEDDGMNKYGSEVVTTGVEGAVNVAEGIVAGTVGTFTEGVEEVATDGVPDPGNLTKLGLGVEIAPGIGLLVNVPAF